MRWSAALFGIAVALGGASPGAAAAVGHGPRIELTGDLVARESLDEGVAEWTGPADEQGIRTLRQSLEQRLAARGYIGARVDADLQDGTLWLMVQARRLGDLELPKGLRGLRGPVRERILAALCGEEIGCRHPFVNVQALQAASRSAKADLGVDIHTELAPVAGRQDLFNVAVVVAREVHATVGLDNQGMASTGRNRASVSVQARNLLTDGDVGALYVIRTGKGLTAASASIDVPLVERSRVGLSASRLNYALGGDYEALGYSGVVNEVALNATQTLASTNHLSVIGRLGAEWKATSNTIAAFGASSATRTLGATASLSGSWLWPVRTGSVWGEGVTQFRGELGAGRLQLLDEQALLLDGLSARTAGAFAKLTVDFQHDQRLARDVTLTAHVRGALASRNLDPSEKFVLTGPDALRALPSGRLTADDAVLGTLEAKVPLQALRLPLSMSLSVFVDGAAGRANHRPWAGYGGNGDLRAADAGAALSLSFGRHLSGLVTAATELTAPQVSGSRSTLISFSLNGSY